MPELWVKVEQGAEGPEEGRLPAESLGEVPWSVLARGDRWSMVSKEDGGVSPGSSGGGFPRPTEMGGQESKRRCGRLAGGGRGPR